MNLNNYFKLFLLFLFEIISNLLLYNTDYVGQCRCNYTYILEDVKKSKILLAANSNILCKTFPFPTESTNICKIYSINVFSINIMLN